MIRRAVHEMASALDEYEVDWSLGGDAALAYHTVPELRPVFDFHCRGDAAHVLAAVASTGFAGSGETSLAQLERLGFLPFDVDNVRIRLLLADTPFDRSALHRSQRAPFGGVPLKVLSCADLVVYKAMFNRRKDWADIEQVLHVQGADFDVDYARGWLVAMVGEHDDRTRQFDTILAEVREDRPGDDGA